MIIASRSSHKTHETLLRNSSHMSVDPRKFVQTLCILHIKIAQILCTVVKKTLVVTLWDMCNARSSPRESNVNIQYTGGWWMARVLQTSTPNHLIAVTIFLAIRIFQICETQVTRRN